MKQIGKSIRVIYDHPNTRSRIPKWTTVAVFECWCGELTVIAVDCHRKLCPTCAANASWANPLRERIVRRQLWYKDRLGKHHCVRCGCHCQKLKHNDGRERLCRECEAVAPTDPVMRVQGSAFRTLGESIWKDDPSPGWENTVRVLEDTHLEN